MIVAEPFSKATVVLQFRGSATFADNVEIIVGEGSQLTVAAVQDWADDAVHHTHHHALIKRDGSLRHLAVAFGGDLVRMNTSVRYEGPVVPLELLGLYFADAGQHLENRLFVDHNQPRTRSNVDYKGATGECGYTVWIGDVLIRKVAEGIETYESNKNLVLTDGCRADSVPNLEIETGEIVPGTPRPPAGSTTSSCSTSAAAVSPNRRLVGWWSMASSPTSFARSASRSWRASCWRPRSGAGGQHQRRDGVMSEFVRACRVADVAPESAIRWRSAGQSWRLCTVTASSMPSPTSVPTHPSRCQRDVGDGEIECYLHGSRFDLVPASRSGCRPPSRWPSIAARVAR